MSYFHVIHCTFKTENDKLYEFLGPASVEDDLIKIFVLCPQRVINIDFISYYRIKDNYISDNDIKGFAIKTTNKAIESFKSEIQSWEVHYLPQTNKNNSIRLSKMYYVRSTRGEGNFNITKEMTQIYFLNEYNNG